MACDRGARFSRRSGACARDMPVAAERVGFLAPEGVAPDAAATDATEETPEGEFGSAGEDQTLESGEGN